MSLKRTNLSVAALCLATLGMPAMIKMHSKARTHTRWKTSTSTMRMARTCSMKMEAVDFKPEGETPREALGSTMRDTEMVATNKEETLITSGRKRGTNVRDDRPAIIEGGESPERV